MSDVVIYLTRSRWIPFQESLCRDLPPMYERHTVDDRTKRFRVIRWPGKRPDINVDDRLYIAAMGRIQCWATIIGITTELAYYDSKKRRLARIWYGRRKRQDNIRSVHHHARAMRNARKLAIRRDHAITIVVRNDWVHETVKSHIPSRIALRIKPFPSWYYARFSRDDLFYVPLTGTPEFYRLFLEKATLHTTTGHAGRRERSKLRFLTSAQIEMYEWTGRRYIPQMWRCENGTYLALIRKGTLHEWPPRVQEEKQAGDWYYTMLPSGECVHNQREPNWAAFALGSEYDGAASYSEYSDFL